MRAGFVVGVVVLLFAGTAFGQTDDEGWGDEAGTDQAFDFGNVPKVKADAPAPPRPYSLTGFLRSDWGFWVERFDDHPWAKGRQSLDLAFRYVETTWRLVAEGHVEYDLSYLQDRDRFDEATLETYEWRIIGGEMYGALDVETCDFTLGRQIVAWGEGDALSPVDVVNPRDLREPGLADLDDLRLAVGAFRAGCSVDGHRMEMMILPENHFGERPPPLGEFSPLRGFIEGNDLFASLLADKTLRYTHRQDRFDARSLAVLLRWSYKGPGLDAGLFVASLPDRQGVVILPALSELTRLLGEDEINIELDHRRYTMLGHAGATTLGSWLFKWELAGEVLRSYNTGDPNATLPSLEVERGTLLTGMLGVTYGGFTDTQLTLEAQRGVFIDRPDDLLFPVDAPIFAARAMHRALRERLTLLGVATAIGLTAQYGWLARAEATYKLEEFITGFQVTLGYVHYSPGDPDEFSPFYGFDAHDRVFARLRWDFTAL